MSNPYAGPTADGSVADGTAPDASWSDDTPVAVAVAAARAADDKLATDVVVLDVGDVLGICDHFVIASASNERQVKAVVDGVEEALRDRFDRRPRAEEGKDARRWVLLDYGDVVVHVFHDGRARVLPAGTPLRRREPHRLALRVVLGSDTTPRVVRHRRIAREWRRWSGCMPGRTCPPMPPAVGWWSRWESNPRPLPCHGSALPTELRPRKGSCTISQRRAPRETSPAARVRAAWRARRLERRCGVAGASG